MLFTLNACSSIKLVSSSKTYHSSSIFSETKDSGLHKDKYFTPERVENSHFFYYGMVNKAINWNMTPEEKARYGNYFIGRINKKRDDIKLVHKKTQYKSTITGQNIQYESSISDQSILKIVKDIQLTGKMSLQEVADFNLPPHVDYLIISTIDDVKVNQTSRETEKDGQKYRVLTSAKHVILTTWIIDIITGEQVWSWHLKENKQSTPITVTASNNGFLKELIFDLFSGGSKNSMHYPKAPEDNVVIENAISKVVSTIPQKSCSNIGYLACIFRSIEQQF